MSELGDSPNSQHDDFNIGSRRNAFESTDFLRIRRTVRIISGRINPYLLSMESERETERLYLIVSTKFFILHLEEIVLKDVWVDLYTVPNNTDTDSGWLRHLPPLKRKKKQIQAD